jgi:misacylated tRNA(Ala) deacylase
MGVTHHGRTYRLDLADPTLREWECTVLAADAETGIVLDRSAFYPGGGGQPPDHGVLLWNGVQTRIVGTRKGDDLYLLPAEGDPLPPPGTTVTGAVEDQRRTLLMRTHSGLHVLCGVVFRDFGALVTGGNMEPGEARMDFNLPEVPSDFKSRLEELVNAEVTTDRSVAVRVLPRDEALVLGCHNDDVHPASVAEALADALPKSELYLYDAPGVLWNERADVRARVASFLNH